MALFTRKDHGPKRGPSARGRLSLLGAAWRFTRGTGKVPRMHLLIPDATFAPVIYPIIFAIEGITGGAYRYAHNEHALVPIRDVDRQTVADTAILQHEHSTGVALLFLVVPLSHWLVTFGDRANRNLSRRAKSGCGSIAITRQPSAASART